MKNAIYILLILIGISIKYPLIGAGISKSDATCYAFIRQFAKQSKNKYRVTLSAIGGGDNQGTWLMTALFRRKGPPLTKEEARRLMIEFAEDFLKGVNSNQKIRPFLRDFP